MSSSLLSHKHLQDEETAYAWVEAHVWPDGPVCPHCGSVERLNKMQGKATRIGLYKCYACRKQFNVKVGTIFEKSHIPMRIWLQAFFLLAGSKKGISSNQLHRTLGITLKSAWFMSHRIREAMRSGALLPPMGGSQSQMVEADETFIGRKEGQQRGRSGYHHKNAVLTLVDRQSGRRGIYQHCSEKHLHRYLAEFDFRYSNRVRLGVNDEQRAARLVKGAKGKRLTYRPTGRARSATGSETPPPF